VKHSVLIGLLFMQLFVTSLAIAEEAAPGPTPPVYFVLFHSPGPSWNPGLTSDDQPGMQKHHRYMNKFKDVGIVILGGPYLDDSGGMMIIQTDTIEEARLVANSDPAVKSGLLRVSVKSWQAELSSVRMIGKRRPTGVLGRKQAFKIKSANQGAPINLDEEPN